MHDHNTPPDAMNSRAAFFALFLCSQILATNSLFSPNFSRFLYKKYGFYASLNLIRADVLDDQGSFGGGKDGNVSTDPVVLVHGATDHAGMYSGIKDYFLSNNYNENEVYATTYAYDSDIPAALYSLKCEYVQLIRQLIIAVHEYTGRNVNVIAYSLGSPIARKAILGSRCMDTNEDLGLPLTSIIKTFVGVAGANHGSFLCIVPVGVCNDISGLACNSRFLRDINSKVGYEGKDIYTLYSMEDDVVGYKACGKIASAIKGQKAAVLSTGNHKHMLFRTSAVLYDLIEFGYP